MTNAYSPAEHRPLRGYLVLMAAYAGATASTFGLARLLGRRLPNRVPLADIALLAVATHKLSRLLTKDAVTSPLRAPFVSYREPAGEGELNESPSGQGLRHAVGELVTCPFCLAVWIATGLTAGLVFAPRPTRLVLSGASAVAAADHLHLVYGALKAKAEA